MAETKLDITVTPDFTKLIEGLESVAATLLEAADKIRALQSPEAALDQSDTSTPQQAADDTHAAGTGRNQTP